jgi:hypothetical protein
VATASADPNGITEQLQAASDKVNVFVNGIVANADHGLSADAKSEVAVLEEQVEKLQRQAAALAGKHKDNYRLQYIASALANVEDSCEDIVSSDQLSDDSRGISVDIYTVWSVLVFLLEVYAGVTVFSKVRRTPLAAARRPPPAAFYCHNHRLTPSAPRPHVPRSGCRPCTRSSAPS